MLHFLQEGRGGKREGNVTPLLILYPSQEKFLASVKRNFASISPLCFSGCCRHKPTRFSPLSPWAMGLPEPSLSRGNVWVPPPVLLCSSRTQASGAEGSQLTVLLAEDSQWLNLPAGCSLATASPDLPTTPLIPPLPPCPCGSPLILSPVRGSLLARLCSHSER